jgi:hypothetical protein
MHTRVRTFFAAVIASSVSISIAAICVYLNSAPTISVQCTRCESSCDALCTSATEDYGLWGMIQKQNLEVCVAFVVLCLIGLYAACLITERALFYFNASRQNAEFKARAAEALYSGQYRRAIRLSRDYRMSPLATVINAVYKSRAESCLTSPANSSRHEAIVAQTAELNWGIWHLSAIGWSIGFIALLVICFSARNLSESSILLGPQYEAAFRRLVMDSSVVIVLSALVAPVILAARKCFATRVETLQIEMERLSLSFMERVSLLSSSKLAAVSEGREWSESKQTSPLCVD